MLVPIGISVSGYYYFFMDAKSTALNIFVHCVLGLVFIPIRFFKVSNTTSINVGLLILCSFLFGTALRTGGPESVALYWLPTIPLIASSYIPRRYCGIWIFIVTSIFIFFFTGFSLEHFPSEVNPESLLIQKAISGFSMIVTFGTFAFISAKGREFINLKRMEAEAAASRSSNLASLGEMAGGIAHEINNPLMIISGSALVIEKQLKKPVEDIEIEKLEKHLNTIKKTVKRASVIIKGLKTLARDGSNDKTEEMQLCDLFEDVLSFMGPRLRHQDISLNFDIQNPLLRINFPLYKVQFSQVILNLLNNSFDAIENNEEKWIAIDLEKTEAGHFIRITDSGKGIPKEIAEKMFNPFFTTKPVGKGTGLGLPLCHSIVEKCGGTLLYDINHKNTSFLIQLPNPVLSDEKSKEAS